MEFRDMSEETRIKLARSELVNPDKIYAAASQYFAAFLQSGQVTEENQVNAMKKAITLAIELANQVEGMLDEDAGGRRQF